MKKYTLLIAFISFVCYILTYSEKGEMPELALANIEALASGETSGTDCPPGAGGCLSSSGLWWPLSHESQWQ